MTRTFSIRPPEYATASAEVEPPLVERPPRDRPVERRPALLQRPQVRHRRDAARRDHRDRHRPRQRRRRRHVRPRHRPVALDVGIDDRRHARVLEPPRQVDRRRRRSSPPSPRPPPARRARRSRPRPARDAPRAAARTSAGSRSAAVPRITRAHPLLQPRLERRPVADAAAELHRHLDRRQDRLDRARVHRPPGEGAVEVDQVQPAAPGRRRRPAPAPPGPRRRRSRSSIAPRSSRTHRPSFRSIAG